MPDQAQPLDAADGTDPAAAPDTRPEAATATGTATGTATDTDSGTDTGTATGTDVPAAGAESADAASQPTAAPAVRPVRTPGAVAPTRPGASSNRVRARLARLGVQRSSPYNPVLEPLLRVVRGNDPKGDSAQLRQIEQAYQVAERWHRGQKRKSGDPYITHPLAVTTILAELGMDPATLMAGLLHDTVEDTDY
ncbi:MAG: diphosphokinase / guanosine-3,5-bis(diphosphate) 3-diphosphatase, partial [Streptomyces sp.]|nr:diphosphokinase / guanosine-3,5-bis(diphosphate) 3-diphosphatase [Streptomyces sp.]